MANEEAIDLSASVSIPRHNSDPTDLVTKALHKAYRLRSEMLTSVMSRPRLESSDSEGKETLTSASCSDSLLSVGIRGLQRKEPLPPLYSLITDDSLDLSSLSDNREVSDSSSDSLPDELAVQNIILGQTKPEEPTTRAPRNNAENSDGGSKVLPGLHNTSTRELEKRSNARNPKLLNKKLNPRTRTLLQNLQSVKICVFSLHLDNSLNIMDTGKKASKYAIVRSCRSRTFLVELFLPFPTKLASWDIYGRKIESHEPLKFWSRIEKSGVILFHQEFVVPVIVDENNLDWIDKDLVFKISVRPYRQKEATVVGSCNVEFSNVLKSPTYQQSLPLQMVEDHQSKRILNNLTGKSFLKVKIVLNSGLNSVLKPVKENPENDKGLQSSSHRGENQGDKGLRSSSNRGERQDEDQNLMPPPLLSATRSPRAKKENDIHSSKFQTKCRDDNSKMAVQSHSAPTTPIKVVKHASLPKRDSVIATVPVQNTLIEIPQYLLLRINEGRFSNLSGPASFYLICRSIKDTSQSEVCWDTMYPNFYFTQVVPLVLTRPLLETMKDGVIVIEIWQKVGSVVNDDKLVGLVKLPLRTFFIAFNDEMLAVSQANSEYPVISADGHFPVINPFTGQKAGNIKLLLALGSWLQIDQLLLRNDKENERFSSVMMFYHTFEVFVENLSKLHLRNANDAEDVCSLGYTFPLYNGDDATNFDKDSMIVLKQFSTETKGISQNVNFLHQNSISFSGPENAGHRLFTRVTDMAVEGYLDSSCSHGLTFVLQCFTRKSSADQKAIARAQLAWTALERLALQGLQCGTAVSQTFVLPLYSIEDKVTAPGHIQEFVPLGHLRVSITYSLLNTQIKKDAMIQANSSSILQETHLEKGDDSITDDTFKKSLNTDKIVDNKVGSGKHKHAEILPASDLSIIEEHPITATVPKCIENSEESIHGEIENVEDEELSTFVADVMIERALHLPELQSKVSGERGLPSCYVSFHSDSQGGEMVCTPVIRRSASPVWEWSQEVVLSRNLLSADSKGLVFKIWHMDDDRFEPDKSFDKLVGSCSVDLSPISRGLSVISGWYNIVDLTGKCLGQLKISIVPEENLHIIVSKNSLKKSHRLPENRIILPHNTQQISEEMPYSVPLPASNYKSKARINSASSCGSFASRRRSLVHQPVGCSSHGSSQVNSLQSSPRHSCCLHCHHERAKNITVADSSSQKVPAYDSSTTSAVYIHETLKQQISELEKVNEKIQQCLSSKQRSKSTDGLQIRNIDSFPVLNYHGCKEQQKSSSSVSRINVCHQRKDGCTACQAHACILREVDLPLRPPENYTDYFEVVLSDESASQTASESISRRPQNAASVQTESGDSKNNRTHCSCSFDHLHLPDLGNGGINRHSECEFLCQMIKRTVPLLETHLAQFRSDADGLSDRDIGERHGTVVSNVDQSDACSSDSKNT